MSANQEILTQAPAPTTLAPELNYSPRELHRFSMHEPEQDESSYWGRFQAFRATANPFNSFFSNQQIRDMQALLAA